MKISNNITAREFLKHCGYEINVRNLSHLTDYIRDSSNINYAQFPDANVPDEILEDPEMEANFQDWMDSKEEY